MRLPPFVLISLTMTKRSPIDLNLSAGFCVYYALLILLLPLNLIFSILAAATVHEVFHLLVLHILHIPVLQIRLYASGAIIRTPPLSPVQELLCAAAGPAGSFSCLLLVHRFPLFALCGGVQGLFNLLPLYPLDGGRILRAACLLCCPAYEAKLCKAAAWGTFAASAIACVFLCRLTGSIFYALLPVYFLLQQRGKRKFPCKELQY